jgi:phosphatidylcholine synthase
VSEVLPNFSGAMIDNVIDFLTYIWIPVFIMGSIGVLPHLLWITVPVIAGLYAYGQVDMKTPDNFFLGFPSYWNVIALYLYLLHPEPLWTVLMLVIPGILTFVPTRYLWPSKNRILSKLTWALALIWGAQILYLLLEERPDQRLVLGSFFFPIYYFAASFYVDWQIRHGKLQLS